MTYTSAQVLETGSPIFPNLRVRTASETDNTEMHDPTSNPATGAPTVLLAEDNPTSLRTLTTWLEQAGYVVRTAVDGREAWQIAERDCPPIVLADWNMPGMSGQELCRAIRAEHPRHQVYLLVTTSKDDPDALMHAMSAGADDFLSKPVEENELLARVRQAEWALERTRCQAALAESDPLTRLMNRRTFCQQCEREIVRSQRGDQALSCILMDVDYFKRINDTHGHATGDEALCVIADSLRAVAQPGFSVGRLGGDEFCVLLPSLSEDQAAEVAARIRLTIAQRHISVDDTILELKVTIGVAGWRDDIESPTELLDLADQALLAAKQSGRDRVMRFGELRGELSATALHQYSDILAEIVAKDVMTSPIVSVCDTQPIRDAVGLFFSLRIGSAPVLDEESKLVGIVEESDLLNAAVSHSQWATPIRDVMKKNVISYNEDTPVVKIWEFLRRVTAHHVVIVSEEMPVGVLSRSTLLRWLSNWSSSVSYEPFGNQSDEGDMHQQLRLTTQAILDGVRELEDDIQRQDSDLVPSILNAATRLQEGAQDLLVLCQPQQRFEPGV